MSICFNCHKDGYYSSSCISCERCSPHSLTDLRGMTEERDRYKANLEWLVYWCLRSDDPPISIGRGKELLGFKYMDEMREWMADYSYRDNWGGNERDV